MPLTDLAIRRAKPADRPYKLSDERSLYLLVKPAGKYWRFDYTFESKRKTAALGVYPDVGLSKARERRDEFRRMLADGIDPSARRKAVKLATANQNANSLEIVAREWLARQQPVWAASHAAKVISRLERFIFPTLGNRPIADLTAPALLAAIQEIEASTVETAHRTLSVCGQIMRYAIATGRAINDFTPSLRQALKPVRTRHFAALTEPDEVGKLLRAIDNYQGSVITRSALQLAPLVFVRPGELRTAAWGDIDMDGAEWRFTVSKTNTPHIVPLSKQAIAILRSVQQVTGRGPHVFAGPRSNRPLSDNTLPMAMKAVGFEQEKMTVHGFRAMARTMLDEVLGYRPDFIEHQLAHSVRDPLGRAYNRTAHLAERKEMMQRWADYLDELKKTF